MLERLQKVLSRAGVASRRKAEELITEGRVEVNGRRVTELGTRVDMSADQVRVDGKLVADIEDRVYYVLFKPGDCVTTLSDPEGRPTVRDYVRVVRERVYPVGRLDYDAEGALILTNDGELAHRLMHPRYGARRVYLAKVKGTPTERTIEQLKEGVRLDDGMAKPLEAELVQRAEKNTWIRLVLTEGRPHLVKRLCEAVGHPVVRLFRSSYAGIEVEGMMPGELRELSKAEVHRLKAIGTEDAPRAPAGRALPPRRDARRRSPAPRAPKGGR
jgi:23S rRNA pseudouridine2605 synthase